MSKVKKTVRLYFIITEARLAFTKLRQAFIKALILRNFDPKRHIRVETDVSGYAFDKVLSQLTSKSQLHPMAFFFHKIILIKTRYETHDSELLAIVEAFKT